MTMSEGPRLFKVVSQLKVDYECYAKAKSKVTSADRHALSLALCGGF